MYKRVLATLEAEERTQAWLARRIGVSTPYMSLVLRGRRPMPRHWPPLIAQALDVPEFLLFLDAEAEHKDGCLVRKHEAARKGVESHDYSNTRKGRHQHSGAAIPVAGREDVHDACRAG